MKSRAAFQFTVLKMARTSKRLYFWTFTYREVLSLRTAMGLWNEFLTIIKRLIRFQGVRVLELHDEHGCHFHVITNRRYKIHKMLELGARYGFGRLQVAKVDDVEGGIAYLCKYLSKPRVPCLKGARLWAAFGDIERTRVSDVVSDNPFTTILRRVMGAASAAEQLASTGDEVTPKVKKMCVPNFLDALPKAWNAYYATFDPEYAQRQATWAAKRFNRACLEATTWFGKYPDFIVEA